MKAITYSSDSFGCGAHRIKWPTEVLAAQGHDVHYVAPEERSLELEFRDGVPVAVRLEDEAVDVIVFQRVTHAHLAAAIPLIRAKGIAVVVDVDDDLSSIHPGNAAFYEHHPKNFGTQRNGGLHLHSWRVLQDACRDATLVTATTPTLARKYAPHGRSAVISNYLADHYYTDLKPRPETDLIGWPASLHNHPNDPPACGNAIGRLVRDGHQFMVFGQSDGCREEFSLPSEPLSTGPVDLLDWPAAISQLTVGIAPLADTVFNSQKSWLKPLEMSARGVPWVASPREEYRKFHALGAGYLAEKPKEWYGIIRGLLADHGRWDAASVQAFEVAKTMRLRDHSWRWLEAWEKAIQLQRQ